MSKFFNMKIDEQERQDRAIRGITEKQEKQINRELYEAIKSKDYGEIKTTFDLEVVRGIITEAVLREATE